MSNQKDELVSRLKAKKKALEADLAQLNADTQGDVNEKREKIKSNLNELSSMISETSENFSENIAKKINEWLK